MSKAGNSSFARTLAKRQVTHAEDAEGDLRTAQNLLILEWKNSYEV